MTILTSQRKQACRWLGWFFVANTIFYFIINLNYFAFLPDFNQFPLITLSGKTLGWVFMVLALLGQSAIFAFFVAVPLWLFALLWPQRGWLASWAIILSSAMAMFLIVDSVVYHLYHYHLLGIVWQILRAGVFTQVIVLTWVEWFSAVVLICLVLVVEVVLLLWSWRWMRAKKKRSGGLVALVLVVALFLSYVLSMSSTQPMTLVGKSNDHVFDLESQVIPYYDTVLGVLMPVKNGIMKMQSRGGGFFVQNEQINRPLNYPLHPLHCAFPHKKYNIVFIVLDAWRFDMLSAKVTPNIYRFSKKSWLFKDNVSGGNGTRPGIFSLFYSIPANYWTAMLKQGQGPVFIDQLLKNDYQMGIFRSAYLHFPAFDQTVFVKVKHLVLETPGAESYDRDRQINKEFFHFIDRLKKDKPFFSFIFYDETHNYCESSAAYPQPFQPAIKNCDRLLLNNNTNPLPYLNRYRNAGRFDDKLVGQVLKKLQDKHLLKNTIVVITADHGEEFNESGLDYWGHTSDYTQWQTRVPLIIYWPGKKPQTFAYRTSHYDVIPTLMQGALACHNPTRDYSVGTSLLNKKPRRYLLMNSYIDYAIVTPKRIIRIYPSGSYVIQDPQGHPIPGATLDAQTLKEALQQTHLYFK